MRDKLIALAILLALTGGLVWLALPESSCPNGFRTMQIARDRMKEIERAIRLYELDSGRWPADLTVLTEPTPDCPDGYIGGPLLDPWHRPYVYRPEPSGGERFTLFSTGPDQRAGTEDDVTLR